MYVISNTNEIAYTNTRTMREKPSRTNYIITTENNNEKEGDRKAKTIFIDAVQKKRKYTLKKTKEYIEYDTLRPIRSR